MAQHIDRNMDHNIDRKTLDKRTYTAKLAWVEIDGQFELLSDPQFDIDDDGTIVDIRRPPHQSQANDHLVYDLGHVFVCPGMVNTHSHSFQRRLRGRTGRRGASDPSSFWSWREEMYRLAQSLDPAGVYNAAYDCFREMVENGITCVGEFHYLHHQANGTPYENANELSLQIVRAANEVGIRLVLLDVYYRRAGNGQASLPEQARFCDGDVEKFLDRIDSLRTASQDLNFDLGLAPHSVRAVPAEDLRQIVDYACQHDLIIHSHVAEQLAEHQACIDEHGISPVQFFSESGCFDRPKRFTAIHAIQVDANDIVALRNQLVCACPSTEADLGDGILPASSYLQQGVRLALGSDSNSVIDLVQEARLLEMHERLRLKARLCLCDSEGSVSPSLIESATVSGAVALGRPDLGRLSVGSPWDVACFDLDHISLGSVDPEHIMDAIFLSGSAAPVSQVWIGGIRRR